MNIYNNEGVLGECGIWLGEGNAQSQMLLFFICPSSSRLTWLNLQGLDLEQREEILQQYGTANRLVAVVHKGDQVFAHVHADYCETLNTQEVTLDGKEVTVTGLTDKEYAKFSELFAAALFGECSEENLEEESAKSKTSGRSSSYSLVVDVPGNHLSASSHSMVTIVERMRLIPGQLILICLQHINEAREKEQKQIALDNQHFEVKKREIKNGVVRADRVKLAVRMQEAHMAVIVHAIEHVQYVRGGAKTL